MRSLTVGLLVAMVSCLVSGQEIEDFSNCTEVISFYLHDQTIGANKTTQDISPATNNVTSFAQVSVFDDKLTESPSIDSKVVGRARGVFSVDSISDVSLLQTFTVELEGRNGSINLNGQNHPMRPIREIAIVGGTSEFRFVQGYATTRSLGNETGGLLFFYQLYVTKLWKCLQK